VANPRFITSTRNKELTIWRAAPPRVLRSASSNSSRSHLCMSQRPISLDLFHQNKVWRGASPVPSIPKEWYAGLPQSNTLFIWPQASVLPFRGLPAQKGGSFPGSLEKERRVLGFFCAPKLPCGSHGIRAVLINTRVIVLCSCSKACCLARSCISISSFFHSPHFFLQ
jgi:hypothetical protein